MQQQAARGTVVEVFGAFLRLGLTAFGGPVAHLAHFRQAFVERQRWLTEAQYAQLIALCQFLPGPASSQVGFGIGLLRAGWGGALAAFVAFTLPSALLLLGFAAAIDRLGGPLAAAGLHGLKLVALAVVAQGVLGMARQLCPDATHATIAAGAAAAIIVSGGAWMQIAVIALGAVAGSMLGSRPLLPTAGEGLPVPHGRRVGWLLLAAFALMLVGLPVLAGQTGGLLAMIEGFYRAGALVFGGGHVVLPLLEETVVAPGWISQERFLAAYGAAQAVPGPMFSIAAFLGAELPGEYGGVTGATLALLAIFLPGFLLLGGLLPIWNRLTTRPVAMRAVAGVNAAVVGLLGAALYDPVWTSAVRGPVDLAIAVVAFTLLVAWRASALVAVTWCLGASVFALLLLG
jgi:chromate transporter